MAANTRPDPAAQPTNSRCRERRRAEDRFQISAELQVTTKRTNLRILSWMRRPSYTVVVQDAERAGDGAQSPGGRR
jgi:hypothetical protein